MNFDKKIPNGSDKDVNEVDNNVNEADKDLKEVNEASNMFGQKLIRGNKV